MESDVQEETCGFGVPSGLNFHGLILGISRSFLPFVCFGLDFFVKLLLHFVFILQVTYSLMLYWGRIIKLGLRITEAYFQHKSICLFSWHMVFLKFTYYLFLFLMIYALLCLFFNIFY